MYFIKSITIFISLPNINLLSLNYQINYKYIKKCVDIY